MMRRNDAANGDTRTSPAASGNAALNPSLFARRINVIRREGTLISSDEKAFPQRP